MSMYEDLVAQGWTPAQIAQYYPGLEPGGEMPDLLAEARERSYQDSMVTLERVTSLAVGGGTPAEYNQFQLQQQLAAHSEIFSDLERAQSEIGLPTLESFREYNPEYDTGTKEADLTDLWRGADEAYWSASQGASPRSGGWGDMLALGIVGLVAFVGLSVALGKR